MGEPDWKERYLILEEGVENCLGCLGSDRISLMVDRHLADALKAVEERRMKACMEKNGGKGKNSSFPKTF